MPLYNDSIIDKIIEALGGWPGHALDNKRTVTATLLLSSQCGLSFVLGCVLHDK